MVRYKRKSALWRASHLIIISSTVPPWITHYLISYLVSNPLIEKQSQITRDDLTSVPPLTFLRPSACLSYTQLSPPRFSWPDHFSRLAQMINRSGTSTRSWLLQVVLWFRCKSLEEFGSKPSSSFFPDARDTKKLSAWNAAKLRKLQPQYWRTEFHALRWQWEVKVLLRIAILSIEIKDCFVREGWE